MISLKLFVVKNADADQLIKNLEETIANINEPVEFEIIDILAMPEKAALHDVFASPMLLKDIPLPLQKILLNAATQEDILLLINNLTNNERIFI